VQNNTVKWSETGDKCRRGSENGFVQTHKSDANNFNATVNCGHYDSDWSGTNLLHTIATQT